MPQIRSFQGLKYADKTDISSLVCPPYDIVSEKQKDALLAKNPHNLIKLELPLGEDRYNKTNDVYQKWLADGVLKQDDKPAIYVYSEDFEIFGKSYSFCGFMAQVKLHEFSEGKILPHENTLSKAKDDRFNLLTATGCSFSGIYSLFDDKDMTVENILTEVRKGEPEVRFTDDEGVTHSLWTVTDEAVIAAVASECQDKQFFIADGHHRYETALRYKKENPDNPNAEYMLMTLVSLQNSGLVVLPTHRIINSELEMTASEYEKLSTLFEIEDVSTSDIESKLSEKYNENKHSFAMINRGNAKLFTLTAPVSGVLESLDVSILHSFVLESVFGITPAVAAAGGALSYTRSAEEAISADVAFILNPTRVSEIRDVALAGGKMPQKSTYFYPKIITGLVMNKLV